MHDVDVNLLGLLNLMEAGRESGLRKVVFASTGGAIYGEPEYTPQDEDHPERPASPYGLAKLSAEHYLRYYTRQFDIDVVSLRYANVYGPRQDPRGDAGVVAIFVNEMLSGAQPVINGSGDQTRDYVYVADIAEANARALQHNGSGVFNIGTAQETSVTELFRLIKTMTGSDADEKHGPAQPGEQQRSVLSYERVKSLLGWRPSTPIREGLDRTVEWFSEHGDFHPQVGRS
jgi:Nucleoside-diphosphate-sugar epimerases